MAPRAVRLPAVLALLGAGTVTGLLLGQPGAVDGDADEAEWPPPFQPEVPQDASLPAVPKILAFGDSWAEMGPSIRMLSEMFAMRSVPAVIRSVARSGTRACQWATFPVNLADAAFKYFGEEGPDYVWYTLGGNDYLDAHYADCSARARTRTEGLECLAKSAEIVNGCTDRLLATLWRRFPAAKVVQCGYDLSCLTPKCFPVIDAGFCQNSAACLAQVMADWQPLHLVSRGPLYTGINVLGATQAAAHYGGTAPGRPDLNFGSPCMMMNNCVHPWPSSVASDTIGDAFWDMYFSRFMTAGVTLAPPPRNVTPAPTPGEGNLEKDLTECLRDWTPSFRHPQPLPSCAGRWRQLTGGSDEEWAGFTAAAGALW